MMEWRRSVMSWRRMSIVMSGWVIHWWSVKIRTWFCRPSVPLRFMMNFSMNSTKSFLLSAQIVELPSHMFFIGAFRGRRIRAATTDGVASAAMSWVAAHAPVRRSSPMSGPVRHETSVVA